jgi:hypothetical protein
MKLSAAEQKSFGIRPPLHPAPLRCESAPYVQYALLPRLAGRADRAASVRKKFLFRRTKLRDERGQAAIFMALFVSTMIMLFAFTTNIGMLVHAKINLQNAADAAAYAGAAVQARQLTNAAYLNWEMRRALKEFLFYYTVRGQFAAMPCYPLDAQGHKYPLCAQTPGEARYDFAFYDPREVNDETGGPYLPTTCVIFDPDNNYCQKSKVAGIPEFPSGGGWGVADPIVAAVRAATAQIIQKKKDDCNGRTDVNRQFLGAWLFNLYPYKDASSNIYIGNDVDNPFPYNGLDRLGVLPRMALLRARINNLEEALNLNMGFEGMSSTITEETMGALRGSGKPLDYYERPIQAFLSAKNNLPTISEDNGNFSDIKLTELVPNQPGPVDPNPNLKNPPILAKFDDLKARVSFANSLFTGIADGLAGNCVQFREIRTIAGFPFGVTKNPNVITYYAVRLEAHARLLFSPFGGNGVVPLSAYAAAKPFGSRIGKNLNPDDTADGAFEMMVARAALGRQFVENGGHGGINNSVELDLQKPSFPNPLITDDPGITSQTEGFTTNSHLGYLRGAVAMLGNLADGVRLAGAYAPWEVGYYNPPASYQHEIIGKFEDNPNYEGKYFTMIAPIYPVNDPSKRDLHFIKEIMAQYMVADLNDKATLEGKFKEFMDALISDNQVNLLTNYISETREDNFHFIPDPMLGDEPDLVAYAQAVGSRWTVAGIHDKAYRRQLTSWNNQKTSADSDLDIEPNSELGPDIGRSGYSVRFISFSSLKNGGQATNDPRLVGIQWTNPLERMDAGGGDAAARIADDINKLKH